MSIPRGTTPTFALTFEDEELDLTQAENVYVTFSYITKTGGGTRPIHGTSILTRLTFTTIR